MRWRPGAITALLAIACVGVAACQKKGGGSTQIITSPSFPQGFLPVLLMGTGGAADVAIRFGGDLYAVAGTSDVTAVSVTTGGVSTFAHVSGNPALISLAPGVGTDTRLFAGDDAGRIWAIAGDGSSATQFATAASNHAITGLAVAPSGFGTVGGSLFAAAGNAGIIRISMDTPPVVTTFCTPLNLGGSYIDLVFSSTTLYVIDQTSGEIDSVGSDGTRAKLQGGLVTPVGIALDGNASELYVADAGDGVLKTVPILGGTPTRRARYDFETVANGIVWDGIGTLAFITRDPLAMPTGSLAIRGASLPRLNPASANYNRPVAGPNVGYGDLEFDRSGAFNLAADHVQNPTIPTDSPQNYLFGITRDGATATAISTGVGQPAERLLGVAVDPFSQMLYVSSDLGHVYQRAPDGTISLLPLANIPAIPLLGLERVPTKSLDPQLAANFRFDPYSGQLVATTSDGNVWVIDPASATATRITSSAIGQHLSDLVFATDGTLYVVDNHSTPSTSRILRVAPDGTATDLKAPAAQLGQPDGIEIDEGAHRLLVTTSTTATSGQLLAVSLDAIPATVTALANPISIDDGYFPTGIVYDQLGTAAFRQGNNSTSLHAVSVAP
jgi:sugar lactone lactonase YvrE